MILSLSPVCYNRIQFPNHCIRVAPIHSNADKNHFVGIFLENFSVNDTKNLLRLNVGFIIHETVGFCREFDISAEKIRLGADLDLKFLDGSVKVTRMAQGLLLQAHMRAQNDIECVRCLEPFSQTLEMEFTDLYTFPQHVEDDTELVVPEDGVLDLGPSLREEVLLAIPINPQCSVGCKGLCPLCGENRNEVDCSHEQELIDPRLESLKAFLEEE